MRPADPNKKKLILKAAEKLFLHYGIRKVTIEDIASESGIGKGTFYLYFHNKDDVLKGIGLEHFSHTINQSQKQLELIGDTKEKLKFLIRMQPLQIYEFVKTFPHAEDLLPYINQDDIERGGYSQSFRSYYSLFQGVLEEGVKKGIFHIQDMDRLIQHISYMSRAFYPPFCVDSTAELISNIDLYADLVLNMITG